MCVHIIVHNCRTQQLTCPKFLTVLQSQHPNSDNIRLQNWPKIANILHSQNSTMTTGCWLTSAEMNLRHCSPHSHRRQHNPAVHTNIRQQSAVKMQRWPSLYIRIVRLSVIMPMAWVSHAAAEAWLAVAQPSSAAAVQLGDCSFLIKATCKNSVKLTIQQQRRSI